ncbi:MAG: ABC transporter substrate-binding protein [Xenococcaceae cyanobacterium]
MNKYIKPISIFFIISLTVIACHRIATVDRQSLKTGSTAITKSSPENNVLKIWWEKGFNPQEDEALQKLISNWEKQTGSRIILSFRGTDELAQNVKRAIQADQLPDIVMIFKAERAPNARLAWQGKLADVSDVVKPLESLYSEDILKTVTLYNNVEKKQSYYAVPIHQATNHIYYWRDLLQQVGKTEQDIPQDWDGFWKFWTKAHNELNSQLGGLEQIDSSAEIKNDIAQSIPKTDIYGLGLPLSPQAGDTYVTFEQILEAYNVSILNKKGQLQIDRPQVRQGIVKVLDWYGQFYQQGYIPPNALNWLNPDNNRLFLNRELLMTANHTLSIPGALRQDPDTYRNKLGVIDFPNKPDGKPICHPLISNQAIVFAMSPHQELAKNFLSYLIKPEVMEDYLKASGGRYAPVLKSAWQDSFWTDSKDPHISTASKTFIQSPMCLYSTFYNPAYSEVLQQNVWGQALKKMLEDNISSEQAADEAIAKIKQIFAEWES